MYNIEIYNMDNNIIILFKGEIIQHISCLVWNTTTHEYYKYTSLA